MTERSTPTGPAQAAAGRGVDAVTRPVLWSRLLSVAEEMGSALRRTVFSEAVREGDDVSTGLFERHRRLVVQTVMKDFPPDTLTSAGLSQAPGRDGRPPPCPFLTHSPDDEGHEHLATQGA